MIPPPFAHRFAGDAGIDIAQEEIDAVFPGGERRRVILRLGAPFERNGFFAIRTELENLDRTDGPLSGDSSMHALVLGLAWIPARLSVFQERHGCKYYYPDSTEEYDHRCVFSVFFKPA